MLQSLGGNVSRASCCRGNPSVCVSTAPHPSGRRMVRRRARREEDILTARSRVLDLRQCLVPGSDVAEIKAYSKHSRLTMLCRNARHSWEAGKPLIEVIRFVSEGPSVRGTSQSWVLVASARMSGRLSQGTRANVWGGRPQAELVRRSKIPHGMEAILPRTPESRRWTS